MSIAEKLQTISDNMKKVYEAGQNNDENTYLLVTPGGKVIPATFVDAETDFNATANDIRKGTVAATGEGVTTGTKVIPSYHTVEGTKVIMPGRELKISLIGYQVPHYDYTKLQAMVCLYNKSLSDSVSTQRVTIGDSVYNVNSTEKASTIKKNSDTCSIDFGVTNDFETPCVIRYMTYKEVE